MWIALITALGFGSVLAAVVGWSSAKAVAISNHRQNWINALRDDIVTYLKEIELVHEKFVLTSREGATAEDLERLQEARRAALLVHRRILLRLNMTERPHIELGNLLESFLTVETTTPDSQRIAVVVQQAREVLKHEWAVTKYGMVTKPVMTIKRWMK